MGCLFVSVTNTKPCGVFGCMVHDSLSELI